MAKYWIKKLGLLPHQGGGFFKETYRSDITIDTHIDSVKKQHNQPVQSGTNRLPVQFITYLKGNKCLFFIG